MLLAKERLQLVIENQAASFRLMWKSAIFRLGFHTKECVLPGRLGKARSSLTCLRGLAVFPYSSQNTQAGEKVYSIDMNPEAVNCMRENVRINRVYGKVVPMLGDAKGIIEERLPHVADRVIMPLPEKAFEYLPCALLAVKKTGGWIHYYDFEYARQGVDAGEKVKLKVSERLQSLGVDFQVLCSRVVRSTGPHWWQVVSDVEIGG